MLRVGDRATHRNSRESFGDCKILEINGAVALVRWDTHRVKRMASRPGRTPLTDSESHVNLGSLYPTSP